MGSFRPAAISAGKTAVGQEYVFSVPLNRVSNAAVNRRSSSVVGYPAVCGPRNAPG